MREIMLMYVAIIVTFAMSVAIGLAKSTRAVLVMGGLLMVAAVACGIFMRNYELVNTVLDYVETNGSSVFATSDEWSTMQLLRIGVVVTIALLIGACFWLCEAKGNKSLLVYPIAIVFFMLSFYLSDKRDIVASWDSVSSNVSSTQELYRLGDDTHGINYEFGVTNGSKSIDWISISNPIEFKHIDSNWEWRVTKNGVTDEMTNVWKTRVRYTDIETDNVSPFMKWLKTNNVKLKVVKIARTEIKVVESNKYYPNITRKFTRFIMDLQLEPVDSNWRVEFEHWKSTTNELNQITKPKSSTEY